MRKYPNICFMDLENIKAQKKRLKASNIIWKWMFHGLVTISTGSIQSNGNIGLVENVMIYTQTLNGIFVMRIVTF